MKNSILKLNGVKVLSKKEQKKLIAGCSGVYERCEPWEVGGDGSGYTVCAHEYGSQIHYSSHKSCDPNLCYGGTIVSSSC